MVCVRLSLTVGAQVVVRQPGEGKGAAGDAKSKGKTDVGASESPEVVKAAQDAKSDKAGK